jgi:hypothetical protein
MNYRHILCFLCIGFHYILCKPTTLEKSFYDAVEEKCPSIKSIPHYKEQHLFKTCKNWTIISEVKQGESKENIQCLLYFEAFTNYCKHSDKVDNEIPFSTFKYDLKKICDYAKTIPNKNLKSIFAMEGACEQICTDTMGMVESVCSTSYYYSFVKVNVPSEVKESVTTLQGSDEGVKSEVTVNKSGKGNVESQILNTNLENKVNQADKEIKSEQNLNEQNTDDVANSLNKLQKKLKEPSKLDLQPPVIPVPVHKDLVSNVDQNNVPPASGETSDQVPAAPALNGDAPIPVKYVSEHGNTGNLNKEVSNQEVVHQNHDNQSNQTKAADKKDENNTSKTAVKPEILGTKDVITTVNSGKVVEQDKQHINVIENKLNAEENDARDNVEENGADQNQAEAELEPIDEDPQSPDGEEDNLESSVEKSSKPLKIGDTDPANYSTEMDGDSYFFTYFMLLCIIFIVGYVCYHNKQKILALILEGRRGKRQYRGRRPNSANYHKLDSNLEEAITSSCKKNTNNVIY